MSTTLPEQPETLPLTVDHYSALVEAGVFDRSTGQIELIRGRLVRMNPQGPQHADPIDVLAEWSIVTANRAFTIRIEKPLNLPAQNSCPEPDVAWVARGRYNRRHPEGGDVHLLIEVSFSSGRFDRGEKLQLYAEAGIPEYWRFDIPARRLEVFRRPHGGDFQSAETHGPEATVSPLCLPEARLAIAEVFGE